MDEVYEVYALKYGERVNRTRALSFIADDDHASPPPIVADDARREPDGTLGIALDETTTPDDVLDILACFAPEGELDFDFEDLLPADMDEATDGAAPSLPEALADPAARARVGDGGRRRFAERFAAEPFAQTLAAAYAGLGIDCISVGAITNSAPVLDIGLDIDPGDRSDEPAAHGAVEGS